MTDILLVYIPCKSEEQARTIGRHLLSKKLCACINIYPEMGSLYFWPPKSETMEEAHEAVLIAKTSKALYQELEDEVTKIHTYKCPCIMAIPTENINKPYYDWLKGELK
ncbi:divalent-cation tolerance protein CutA [Candidatus Roizmanbacteria bacterium CG17_big_fil_post_rev_8_21_14_2_50_39_7]|uniref:Divalent-cation tolerance protein CutA n=1 Tax=Candidatus Roizmanbacteria bacterium CG17_big_fil_post_rev_8_21_14_2_50_39_7 TaxID=1974858 RepID=A0A2M7EJL7_9BACT|nr:MAG: divalent-cation tolerance protein CutA [Candidatus Roizmanbacteria bacterium CG17_big_fil_post_rev_8_21_14_2_50_39_7]